MICRMNGPHDVATCALCLRQVPNHLITRHHLTPKAEGGKHATKTPLCKPCHQQVHATFSNKELAKRYDGMEALRSAASLQPFLRWIARQKPGRNFRTIMSNAHPKSKRR
jgi:5-methylcytosine-specific restriction protein A